MIRTVMTLQEQWVKAQLVDRGVLSQRQSEQDILGANTVLKDAYDTDARPILAGWRKARGLSEDPFEAYLASGEEQKRATARREGVAAGWN
jgi:L-rhamnose isomerase/sugar isomerase